MTNNTAPRARHSWGRSVADRDAYLGFEKRLWATWAPAQKTFSGAFMAYEEAAASFLKTCRNIDERFLIRIFEESASTPSETNMAIALAGRLHTPTLKEKLLAIANSDSSRAQAAQQALKAIDFGETHENDISGMPGAEPASPESVDKEKKP